MVIKNLIQFFLNIKKVYNNLSHLISIFIQYNINFNYLNLEDYINN